MKVSLENVPANQQLLARAISRSLEHYEDRDFLCGKKKAAIALVDSGSGVKGGSIASPKLAKVDGDAIVHFYNDMFEGVLNDLGREVGAKAKHLIEKIIKGTKHKDTLLTQFDLQGNSSNVASRVQEHIKSEGLQTSERDLVVTFQEVLRGLLFEESSLLGPRATEATVARMVEKAAAFHPQFKPLMDQITASIVSETA